MNSSCVGSGMARARSVTKNTAPFSTVTSSRSWPLASIVSRYSWPICAPSSATFVWIASDESNTDLMSPGYSSAGCAGTSTACHTSDRLGVQRQHPVATPGDQPLATQRRPDRHAPLAPPCGDQCVHSADLLVRQSAGTACQQPTANHSAPDRL